MSTKVPTTTNKTITITKVCIAIAGTVSESTENGFVVIKDLLLSKTNYRLFIGPFKNLDSLKKAYKNVNQLNFENIEIIKR